MTTVKIWPDDPQVWDRTMAALELAHQLRPSLTLRCRAGGCQLARLGTTALGPLFTSSWTAERDPDTVVVVNGNRLGRVPVRRHRDRFVPVVSGGVPEHEVHGVMALLALPTDLPQDYPALLVRCAHGDAILDRLTVVGWLRAGKAPKIDVKMPRAEYERPTLDGRARGAAWTTERAHESRQSVHDVHEWDDLPDSLADPRLRAAMGLPDER